MIDNNIPTKRNTTYTPDEVARKSSEELYEISFNKDQKAALDAKFAEGGGGSGSSGSKFVVTFTGSNTRTADCTLEQVIAAYNQGMVVEGRWSYPGDPDSVQIFQLMSFFVDQRAIFSFIFAEDNSISCDSLWLNADGTVNVHSYWKSNN